LESIDFKKPEIPEDSTKEESPDTIIPEPFKEVVKESKNRIIFCRPATAPVQSPEKNLSQKVNDLHSEIAKFLEERGVIA
jgi:hypothetical protein